MEPVSSSHPYAGCTRTRSVTHPEINEAAIHGLRR